MSPPITYASNHLSFLAYKCPQAPAWGSTDETWLPSSALDWLGNKPCFELLACAVCALPRGPSWPAQRPSLPPIITDFSPLLHHVDPTSMMLSLGEPSPIPGPLCSSQTPLLPGLTSRGLDSAPCFRTASCKCLSDARNTSPKQTSQLPSDPLPHVCGSSVFTVCLSELSRRIPAPVSACCSHTTRPPRQDLP